MGSALKPDRLRLNGLDLLDFSIEHDLFGKPVSTFPDHAPAYRESTHFKQGSFMLMIINFKRGCSRKRRGEHARHMQRFATCPIADLLPARGAIGHDDGVAWCLAHLWQQR